ncbi:Deoxyribose-phosphate aldolase [Mycena venus]|uniref:Deoxyribose-phosphate aldolase n=1 Tax=Mycena venus TaxID=2733690 RepID=A0A8H6Y8H7_9AGAR|nr:Deoxyribose-phosphate aldolase [Mycena venus]
MHPLRATSTGSPAAARMSSPEELVLSYGESLYRDFVPHNIGYVFYGIYLVVFAIYFLTTIQNPMSSLGSRLLLSAMLLLCLSSTAQYVADMMLSLEQMQAYLTLTSVPLADRRTVWLRTHAGLYMAQRWPTAFNFVISDLIVIWRASVIYPLCRWIRVSMWSLGLADIAVWLCAASMTSRDAIKRSQDPSTDETINTVALCVSLATNLVGTGAIGVKAWNQRKCMRRHEGMWGSPVSRVLLLLVETGGFWAMVQLVFSVLQQVNNGENAPVDLATAVMARIATYLAAILPTATVIIARSQRSVDHVFKFSHPVASYVSSRHGPEPSNGETTDYPLSSIRMSNMRFGEVNAPGWVLKQPPLVKERPSAPEPYIPTKSQW